MLYVESVVFKLLSIFGVTCLGNSLFRLVKLWAPMELSLSVRLLSWGIEVNG